MASNKLGWQVGAGAAMASLLAANAGAVTVAVPGIVSYSFVGNCVDCAQQAGLPSFAVSATLVLDSYQEGTDLSYEHLVSFHYNGSNLIDPYLVEPTLLSQDPTPGAHQLGSLSGSIVTGGAQTVSMRFGDLLEFDLDANGNWFTCGGKGTVYYAAKCSWQLNSDQGNGGVFTSPAAAVPEPATWGLMALGLAGLGLRRRKA